MTGITGGMDGEGSTQPWQSAPNLRIPSGVFSHSLDLGSKGVHSIAYNTRLQTVSLFEDDSARVWKLLYEAPASPRVPS
jgi:hypothetical protein